MIRHARRPRTFLLLSSALALAPLSLAVPPAMAESASQPPKQTTMPGAGFSPAQRAEIVEVVRQALKTDPTILRDAVSALRADQEQQQAASTHSALTAEAANLTRDPADQVVGNPSGDVTLVVFYDPRCPYCRRMTPTLSALLAADHGVRLVYKDLPILGPASLLESRALLAAQKQGGYVKLMDALMQAPPDATPDLIRSEAQKVGLDWTRLQNDMEAPAIRQRLDANIALARRLGIEGTPAMVVGGQLIPGAVELADLKQAVAAARKG